MSWRLRSFWIAAVAVAYAAFAALRATGGHPLALGALFALPALLALGFWLTAPSARGEDRVDPEARSAARLTLTGAAIHVASRCGTATPGFVAGENLGAALAAMGSLWALARIAPLGGMCQPTPETRRLDAAAFAALLWTVATALPAARAVLPERTDGLDPLLIDYATAAAALGSLGIQLFAAARLAAMRRAELGVAERAQAALWMGSAALAVGLLGAVVNVAPPEEILPVAVAVAAIAAAFTASTAEPDTVSRTLRMTLAATALAGPFALGSVYLIHVRPWQAGPIAFFAAAACAVATLFAPRLARRVGPASGRWLSAFDAATRAAMSPDPDGALQAALIELRRAAGDNVNPPALYRLFPGEVVSVDRAGFLHVERAELPLRLLALADEEPERILRIEAMRAVAVRRPEVRPLIAWMEERRIAAMSVVKDADGPIGAVSVPQGARTAPMTLEEVRALRALSDRLGAVIGVSAMLSRSRDRELLARGELEEVQAGKRRLAAEIERVEGQFRAIARMLEGPARVALYSPAAQAAAQQLEAQAQGTGPVTLVAAPGIDAVAWAAFVHLLSPRKGGAMVIVDGTSPAEHDVARWQDREASPFRAAAGGTLVVLDAHMLPPLVQQRIASASLEEVGLVVALPGSVSAVAASGKLIESLADRLGDRAVALPELGSRAEDLHALVRDALMRIGHRLRQTPIGLDGHALKALVEHPWPGNDAELWAVLFRAALALPADAKLIGLRELEASGFSVPPGSTRRARGGSGTIPAVRKKKGAKTT
ncbi:hypothetical protein [Polyangium aurulentum]|uniref:hypothetical protein n=1 Tax=Polyangium aurulentum TaxID=2567896 RepID=UPI0010AED21A|nr:hypothetical protein [Polyangium aurulentum]UQA63467.1 hypothetical protein E8A73_024525 [Polyangium aurulentum]